MEYFLQQYGWLALILLFLISYIWGLLWQALMQKVWGGKIIKEVSNGKSLYLKTKTGEFRFDSTHRKFSFKLKKDKTWQSTSFDNIRNIHIHYTNDTASLIEFFLGDWGLWDLAGKYRDVINTFSIQIFLQDRQNIPILVLKQYEQREWWLGRIFLSITINILRFFNLHQQAEDVAYEKLNMLVDKFHTVGLDINVRPN